MKQGIMKRITALLTAGLLIVGGGIHALPVHAEEKYEFVLITDVNELDNLKDRVIRPQTEGELTELQNFREDFRNKHFNDQSNVYILYSYYLDNEKSDVLYYLNCDTNSGICGLKLFDPHISLASSPSSTDNTWESITEGIKRFMTDNHKQIYLLTRKSTSGSSSQNQDQTPSQAAHTHAYSWVTVQEANVNQDGIEEYRCSCGDVQDREVIPASQVFVNGLYGSIKDTPANGTATYDSKNLYTLSDYVVRKLAERTDVTTIINFTYQGTAYRMTIPAGTDFTSLLADTDYFYGYFYFAQQTGAMIETI